MTEKEEKNTDSELRQFVEFGGIIDLDISIRIPCSYYSAVKAYCEMENSTPNEFINSEIIDAIEAIELGHLTDTFIKKYRLRDLSKEQRRLMVQHQRVFTLNEERLDE